jgi:predicted DNA-binding ribbon-helix-helix protein
MIKKSMKIAGHSTSLALEPEYWVELEIIAREEYCSVPQLITRIDNMRVRSLASTIRLFVLAKAKDREQPQF